jgi:putative FmdB family regulatory protein
VPTYEYACNSCGDRPEIVQSFHEDTLTVCPNCGESALRKVFGNIGVVFKGAGFYRNDSRAEAKKADAKPAAKSDTKVDAGSAAESSSSAATPATAAPVTKTSDSGSSSGKSEKSEKSGTSAA